MSGTLSNACPGMLPFSLCRPSQRPQLLRQPAGPPPWSRPYAVPVSPVQTQVGLCAPRRFRPLNVISVLLKAVDPRWRSSSRTSILVLKTSHLISMRPTVRGRGMERSCQGPEPLSRTLERPRSLHRHVVGVRAVSERCCSARQRRRRSPPSRS